MIAKRKMAIALLALLVLVTGTAAAPAWYGSLAATLPINIKTWVPVAMVAVLLIIMVAALVYMLSGIMGNESWRAWSLGQVYEALMSFILLLAFAFFTYLFFVNPQTAFGHAGLVPPQCTGTTTIYTLAACDISTFNGDAFSMAQTLYLISYFAGITSGINIAVAVPSMPDLGVSFGLPSFIPTNAESMLGTAFDAIIFTLILNQIQVILIAGALLFLSVFMVLGLIARTFGVTRTFGGAMIAFGLGLGLVYPLLVTITYGFITTSIGTINVYTLVQNIGITLIQLFLNAISFGFVSTLSNAFLMPFLLQLGYIIAGLTFLPFLNFTILDAFILDFSRAMGQQMDFMSLLQTLV